MTIATQIIDTLNAQRAIDNGLSNGDAVLDAGLTAQHGSPVVSFSYPAPVMSGACVGTLQITADGSILDDTCDQAHASFDAFVADLESMMEV